MDNTLTQKRLARAIAPASIGESQCELDHHHQFAPERKI